MKAVVLISFCFIVVSCNLSFFVKKQKVLHNQTGYLLAFNDSKFFFPNSDTSSINMVDKINGKQAYMIQGYCNYCDGLIKELPQFRIYEVVNNMKDTSLLYPQIVKLAPVIINYTINNNDYGSSDPRLSSKFIFNGNEFNFIEGKSLNYTIWNIDCNLLPKAY